MPAKAGITAANKMDDIYGAESPIGDTPLDLKCAACTGGMREGEPRIVDHEGNVYHPEHYEV